MVPSFSDHAPSRLSVFRHTKVLTCFLKPKIHWSSLREVIPPEPGIGGNRTGEKHTECWNALKVKLMETAERLNIKSEWERGLVDSHISGLRNWRKEEVGSREKIENSVLALIILRCLWESKWRCQSHNWTCS